LGGVFRDAGLRHARYTATFAAVQRNPWLGGYYDRLMAFLKSL